MKRRNGRRIFALPGKLRTVSERVTIRNARRGRRNCCTTLANPPRSGQRISKVRALSWAQARRAPGFSTAMRRYRLFHGAAPSHASIVRIADGVKRVTRRTVIVVGSAPSLEYQALPGTKTNKSGKNGRRIVWKHALGEGGGKRPLMIHDPASEITSLVGGSYRLRDWYHA